MKSQKLYRLFGELRQEFPDSIEAAEACHLWSWQPDTGDTTTR